MEDNRINILGVPVQRLSMEEVFNMFVSMMEENRSSLIQIVTPNSEIVWRASKNPELKKLIAEADIVIPDGIGLVHASRILRKPLKERVAGIDFLSKILEWLDNKEGSLYLFGGLPGIAQKAGENIAIKYPSLKIAGSRHGYFTEEEEVLIAKEIKKSGADVLCVALGSPKQENFIRKYRDILNVKAAMGVGGSLDVWANVVKRAPEFFRNNGLEWFYRLITQPKRIGRMLVLPLFILKVLIYGNKTKER